MYKDKYELSVLVNGKQIPQWFHNGRFYIQGNQGSEYTIKLKNHSHKRLMAVFSVDGVEVLKGGEASKAESGYVINSYSSVEIKGYRLNDEKVASFKFGCGRESYATEVENKFDPIEIQKVKKGEKAAAKNNGVIGVRIWEEKEPKIIPEWKQEKHSNKKSFYHYVPPFQNYNNSNVTNLFMSSGCAAPTIGSYWGTAGCSGPQGCSGGASFGIASSTAGFQGGAVFNNNITCASMAEDEIGVSCSTKFTASSRNRVLYQSDALFVGPTNNVIPNFELGTVWGKVQEDKVVKVDFEKADSYIDLELFYLTRDELKRIGVDIGNEKKVFLSGFPKAFEQEEYCKKPINW